MRTISEITHKGTPLQTILDEHAKWVMSTTTGTRANLHGANLSGANLSGADLRGADLYGADLSDADLRGAHLIDADLSDADLSGADLRGANLHGANLIGANLRCANLRSADLRGAHLIDADLDYSCWPLSCGSKMVKVDTKIAAQIAAHFCVLDCDDLAYEKARKAILKFARTSHRAKDLGLMEETK